MAERRLHGIPAAPGVAVGRIVRYQPARVTVTREAIAEQDVPGQVQRLHEAVAAVRERINAARAAAMAAAGEKEAAVFDAHLLMLEDPALTGEAERRIREDHQPAALAVEETAAQVRQQFAGLEDPYLRARAADVDDVALQILRALSGQPATGVEFPEHTIIVAEELFPSDTALFDPDRVVALVTERGSQTSHVAILARALEMPAIVGLEGVTGQAREGEGAIVDGTWGDLILDPNPDTLPGYQDQIDVARQERARIRALHEVPAVTQDGIRLTLMANIGAPAEAEVALANGAEGVGLFRTEFLFVGRDTLPSEQEQYEAYRHVAEVMGVRPVVIRTLDAGGDKPVPGIRLPEESNPFLGVRGIRLSFRYPDIFKTQVRAILRAATTGNVWMMFPMVSTIDDVRDARRLVDEVKDELNERSIPYRYDVPIGIMIEVPAAALGADVLIREVDFFSIGTNDLAQYALAVDRSNATLAGRYPPLDIGVLRMIANTVSEANAAAKAVAVCGELAADPNAIPTLIGLGVRELSMTSSSIGRAKQIVRGTRVSTAEQQVRQRLTGGLPD